MTDRSQTSMTDRSQISEFFDSEAGQWSERYARDPRFARRFEKIASLLDRIAPSVPGRALDAGCGTGVFSRYLAARGWDVTAFDASQEMIETAIASSQNFSIEFIQATDQSYESHGQTFNLILSLSALEYVEDDEAAIQKFYQLLKPGGLLVVSVPNKAGMLRKMEGMVFGIRTASCDRLFGKRGEYLKFQKRQYTPLELDILMRQHGMKKKRCIFLSGGLVRPRWLLPFLERRWWAAMYCAVYEKK